MNLSTEIKGTTAERDKIAAKTSCLKTLALVDQRTQQLSRQDKAVDRDLIYLSDLIEQYYYECFNASADKSALMKLEQIENELEEMYRTAAKYTPQFLAEKQMAINRARRDEKRRKKQEALAIEQQKKVELALERAKQPTWRRTGRRLLNRMLPIAAGRQMSDSHQQDEQIQEMLLYGPLQE